MKKTVCALLLLSILCGNINILPAFAKKQCISENKIVTAKSGASVTVGEPSNLVDGAVSSTDEDSYYQWNYEPWFCIDLDGYYEISGLEWIARYETTQGELNASIYGAVSDDWSDKELIADSESGTAFEYTIPEGDRPVYRYIIVQSPKKGCGLGGKEFYVYGKDVSDLYSEDKAYDGDSRTYWMSGSKESYLQLDLGKESIINAVELSARQDIDNSDERTDFEIWLSNDAEFNNYVAVPCVSSQTNIQRNRIGKTYDFKNKYRKEIDLPDKYRYVRYVKLSGIATVSEINVFTDENETLPNEEIVKTGDFEIDSRLIDGAGDLTDVFVPNSNIELFGTIKNNTEKDTEVYVIAAAYNGDGTLKAVSLDEKLLPKHSTEDFSCILQTGSGAVRSLVMEKYSFKPVFETKDMKMYTDKEKAVYVSAQNGDDNNDGSVLAPFRTIERAKTAVNEIEESGDKYIRIKNGEYRVNSSIEITDSDSGSENGYIIYEGFGTEETVLSAGKRVDGFICGNDGIYYASVSGVENVKDVYVNGERRELAASEILVATDEVYDTENKIYGPVVSKELLPEGIVYNEGMDIYYPSVNWRSYSMKLDKITDNDQSWLLNVQESLPVSDRTTYNLLEKFDARAFYLRNSIQLIDEEGEWYFDNESSVLYYKPYSFEDMKNCDVTVSGIDTIFNINNAEYIEFDGLTFAHTGWQAATEKGEMRWQGHNQVLPVQYEMPPAALYATYSQNIGINNCVFRNLGAVGIGFNWGMKSCSINGNVFYDTADGAMYLGNYRDIENSKYGKTEVDLPESINVRNNVINNTGAEYHTAAAVQVYAGKNINIEHNDISHCPYTAIAIGPLVWTNNLAESDENHESGMYGYNRICNNRIHETNKLNPDGGAIYTLGHNHGTVISGNYIKNQYMDYGAIYNDKGSACFEIYDNVSENVPSWLYAWSEEIYFIKAYNNYSTTDETYGGLFCEKSEVEGVKLFETNNKPETIREITDNAGLDSEYKPRLEKYIPVTPDEISPVFGENVKITANVGENILLYANFAANDSERYRWRVIGSNKSKVTFKDTLHGWLKKGRQFEKIYASFSEPGVYEIICTSDDERGYIYASKQYVTVN